MRSLIPSRAPRRSGEYNQNHATHAADRDVNVHFSAPDAGSSGSDSWPSFVNALLATALFRCWHILLFFGAWSTAVCVITVNVRSLAIQPTLITVFGTVLGFVISYRTTSSFERYNDGRKLWSQIVLNSRTFARTVWFHIPDNAITTNSVDMSDEELKARTLIEKKTIINLLEAYAVAVKHYLRGEDGIFYTDLYPLVKFLPSYALPASIPSAVDLHAPRSSSSSTGHGHEHVAANINKRPSAPATGDHDDHLPLPTTTRNTTMTFVDSDPTPDITIHINGRSASPDSPRTEKHDTKSIERAGMHDFLLPAQMPPKYSVFDIFPFSLLVKLLSRRGLEVSGRKAARLRAAGMGRPNPAGGSHNVPLEVSLYLSSYISALQQRKTVEAPTISLLLATLNQLVDALTNLERILTTPIPFSYSIHLWLVTLMYCLALPFQIWSQLKWLTIPATVLASFIFFGFLVAGEEIENPFGYDKNDLNMDHFVRNIIRKELRAITAMPSPDPGVWAFSSENDFLFASATASDADRVQPTDWVRRGVPKMQEALSLY
ncbi:Bestrophin, RFP-TM, chloride channel-domain-containing protein [Hygrophoropsis aurantiaca]|uniref:Bestrophin, RFP-TM, chloride channel-domain-containing protein n=1 Tax=Hygrophoropsis aurantiaca TaxID=72124 RepID=A0ACB8A1Y4_9AGAM|nr:Bestrophin, RFP-TM, chloride channel-domain-containing protein [Hygrophoropsis aurantiaca]